MQTGIQITWFDNRSHLDHHIDTEKAVLGGSRCPQNHRVALRAAGVSFNVDGRLDTVIYQLRSAPTSAEAARRTALTDAEA